MKAKSIQGKSTEEIKATLDQSIAADFKPTLAVVLLSVKQKASTEGQAMTADL